MATVTNWAYLAKALAHYEKLGYKQIEVPWSVPHRYNMATCPDPAFLVNSTVGELVGSAEQSFIYLDHTEQLGKGLFMACTPCFRNEVSVSDTNRTGFMKVELYSNLDTSEATLKNVVSHAMSFFHAVCWEKYGSSHNALDQIKKVHTDTGYDIEIGGFEVGSYGIREWEGLRWIYATGVAEPRLSIALDSLVLRG